MTNPSASSNTDMVIFARVYDLLDWLLPRCDGFPRTQRWGVTRRLVDAALDAHEALIEANSRSGAARLERLESADAHLDKVRAYLRMVHAWGWLSSGQYRHVSVMVAEVGRLLGGWLKQTRRTAARDAPG